MAGRRWSGMRILAVFLFLYYLIALLYVCLLSHQFGRDIVSESYRYNLIPFREIHRFYTYREVVGIGNYLINLFGNIVAFVPFGILLPVIRIKERKLINMAVMTFLLSLCIETTQLIFKIGAFDIDDLILNTLGGILGYVLFRIARAIRRCYVRKGL